MINNNYLSRFIWLVVLSGASMLSAQDNCAPVSKLFDTGRAKMWHSTSGQFWKAPNGGNGFEVDDEQLADAPVQVAEGMSLWMIGKDNGGNVKASLPTPVGNGWFPGPLNVNGESTPELCSNFNKIWEVTPEDLIQHRKNFGNENAEIPLNIRAWPGKNNPFFEEANGFELPQDEEFAPFWDYGTDGIPDGNYDPDKGDYPDAIFRSSFGVSAKKMQWWVFNDKGLAPISELNAFPIRMQVECIAYSFNCDDTDRSTILYDFKVKNKAIEPILDLRMGFQIDPTLGCPEDDFFGSDPERQLAYIYNGDGQDGMDNCLCENNDIGFCSASPILAIKALRGPVNENFIELGWEHINYFVDDEMADPAMQPPNSFEAYNNYLEGLWANGEPITINGNGLNANSQDYETTNYVFNDRPSEDDGWSMCTEDLELNDPNILCSFDGFSLLPNAQNYLSLAVMVTDQTEPVPCAPLFPLLLQNDWINNLLGDPFEDPCPLFTPEPIPEINLQVYPNPASEFIIIKSLDGKSLREARLLDTAGRLINEFLNIEVEEIRIENPGLNGMYFLEITTLQEERSIHKVLFHT